MIGMIGIIQLINLAYSFSQIGYQHKTANGPVDQA